MEFFYIAIIKSVLSFALQLILVIGYWLWLSLLERLSMTFTANGKNRTFGV